MNLQSLKGVKICKSELIHKFLFPAYFVIHPNARGTTATEMQNVLFRTVWEINENISSLSQKSILFVFKIKIMKLFLV